MLRAYGQVWQALRAEIESLARRYYEAQQTGQPVSPSWLFERQRLDALIEQVEREMERLMVQAEARIRAQQLEAVEAAGRHAQELAAAAAGRRGAAVMVNWNRLPTEALTSLVGFSGRVAVR